MMRKLFLWFISTLIMFQFLQAEEPLTPSSQVVQVAAAYAQHFYGGRIDDGVSYFGPGKGDMVWVFTVYKNNKQFPTKAAIETLVSQARNKRLIAKSDFENYRQSKNIQGMREAIEKIRLANTEMRREELFASIYVADYQNGYRTIALRMHHGLPPHYTVYLDAEKKAKQYLNNELVTHARYLYLNPEFVFAGFASATDTAYTSLFFPDDNILNNLDLVEFSKGLT